MKKVNQNKQKMYLAFLILMIAICLISFVMIRLKASSNVVSEEVIEILMAENEDNPESVKYLVTDNCISRVNPETKVNTFVANFSEGEVVKVYKDKACTEEVTDGFVVSGMYAKYEDNNRCFEISVLGDINEKQSKTQETNILSGDGLLNQIELTRDIRQAVGDEKWAITDEVEKKSADVNCNNQVDEGSVKTIVDYIVFGDLNIPEVNIVEKPSLEVVEGKINANTTYTTDVVLKLTEKDDNSLKTVYKITGDINEEYKEALDGEEIVLNENGIYKITAYTYGELENKSKREYIIININKTANYKVEYYLENVNGEFNKVEEDTQTLEGVIGETVEIPGKLYTDYELDVDNTNGVLRGEVLEDGSLVLKAYYERKSFSYIIKAGENIESISTQKVNEQAKTDTTLVIKGKWGEKFTIDAKVKEQDGYVIEWSKWENIQDKNDVINDRNTTLTIEKQNKDYVATAKRNVINYTIEYNLNNGKLAEGVENLAQYNIETTAFTLNNPSKLGYIFTGWTGGVINSNGEIDNTTKTGTTGNVTTPTETLTIESGSIGNRKYTANWKAIENTSYTIKHYKETLVTGKYELVETENKEGKTDTEVTASSKTYNGFTFDQNNKKNVLKGIITADGKLVLELYYTRNTYNLTIIAGDNIASVSAKINETNAEKLTTTTTSTIKYKYEQEIVIEAILKTQEGYDFAWNKWESSNSSVIANILDQTKQITMPSQDITLTAKADKTPIIYNIIYNLNGGALPHGVENPSTYTIESQDLTINNLQDGTKLGHNFAGWTGSNGTTPSKNVVIKFGSTGDKTFTANWEKADFQYIVEYYYDNVIDATKTETKTAKYNSVISTFTDKCITGYELKEQPASITISHDESKNVLKVHYVRKSYTVTLEKDENIETITGNGTYKYGDEVEINATLKTQAGYTITWNNWTSKTPALINNNANQTATITMPAGDITLKATSNKTANEYTIQYMLNGGIVAQENPTKYTVETETFKLNNPTKQGYVFEGWTGGTSETNTGVTGNVETPTIDVTIEKGSLGNRIYTANWVGDSKTKYTVKHYKEKLDGTYEVADTDKLEGTTDSTVIAMKKSYNGYSFAESNENNKLEGIVASDGSLVLSVYYNRNEYTLKLVAGNNIQSVSMKNSTQGATAETIQGTDIQAKYKFGTQINISSVLMQETGYTIEWSAWESNNSEILVNQPLQNALIGMPIGDITLTAKATKKVNSYKYKVEYYYDNVIDNSKTEEKIGTFGSKISNYTDKNKTGYELDKEENKPLTITENEDTNIMKVYYKEIEYTISYNLVGGTISEENKNPEKYTVNSENIILNNPSKVGYTFTGWTGTNGVEPQTTVIIEKGSTGNREYTANWIANTDTEYIVEHYKENLDGSYTIVSEDTQKLVGTTDSQAIATPKQYTGYYFDEDNNNNVKSGIISATEKLVLKLYYNRESYNLTVKAGENIKDVTIIEKNAQGEDVSSLPAKETTKQIKYGQSVSISANVNVEENYNITWSKWESADTNIMANQTNQTSIIVMPASNVELTAKGNKIAKDYNYSVEYYYNNVKDEAKTEIKTAKFATQVSNYSRKDVNGYEFDKVENVPLTITANAQENIIKVYYKTVNYSISYELNEGKLPENKTNPNSYTVESENIEIINPDKVGYIFLGWTGGVVDNNGNIDNSAQTGTSTNITEPTTTLVIEKGSIGNRKYTANYRASTDITYKVEHYTEKLEVNNVTEEIDLNNYTLYKTDGEDGSLIGTTGQTVTATPITITGFTYDVEKSKNTISGAILPDGSLVLKIFYSRNSYKLNLIVGNECIDTVINGEESSKTSIEKTYKYEQEVQISATLATIEGYNTTWKNWTSSDASLLPIINNMNTKITMPAGDITLTANGTKSKANFAYSVEYYYDGVEDTTLKETGKTAEFESQIISYTEKLKDGYEFDKAENLPLTITANPENNVIKVYYKLIQYTITYNLQEGSLEEGKTNLENYNVKTEDFTLNNPVKPNHKFLGWTGGVVNEQGELDATLKTGTTGNITENTKDVTIQKGSIGNRKYTANWEEIVCKVTVHHYLNNTGAAFGNEAVKVAEDEILTSKIVGGQYTTDHLIPNVDENGNSIETDERTYLDPKEFYIVNELPTNAQGIFTEEDIEVIYYYDYYPVVRIIDSPAASLIGTEYNRVSLALHALENAGLTKESALSSLQLIRNYSDESVKVENHNVLLDLNGFKANSKSSTEAAYTVDNSKFTIVDNSTLASGKVISQNNNAIFIKTSGEFTIGKEETPVIVTPVIKGKTNGILKEKVEENEGLFNFFDGKIIGEIAVSGKVDLTPILYNATVTQDTEETSKQASVLAIVSTAEARIGRKLYTQIEEAIEDANTSIGADGSQVEIVVVKDISKPSSIKVSGDKNIVLDLAGHKLTTTSSDYVLKNYGKLEVIDSTANDSNLHGAGSIGSTTTNSILNGTGRGEKLIKSYDINDLVKSNTYGFVESNGVIVSNNTNKGGTTANSYCRINLEGLEGEYIITVKARISSESKYDFGYATITESISVPTYNNAQEKFIDISGTVSSKEYYSKRLTGGKEYYLHFGYKKDGSGNTGDDKFYIEEISLYNYAVGDLTLKSGRFYIQKEGGYDYNYSAIINKGNLYIENGNKENENVLVANNVYSFKKVNGVIESQNVNISDSMSNSYVKIDLTNKEGQHELVLNAAVSSKLNEDYGYATIKEDVSLPEHSDEVGRFMYISGNINATDYSTILEGGKVYYLHLGYYQNNSSYAGSDKLTINSITLDGNEIEIVNNIRPYIYSNYAFNNLITNTGNVTINGGLLYINARKSFGIDSEGNVLINSGVLNIEKKNDTEAIYHYFSSTEPRNIEINGGYIKNRIFIQSDGTNLTINNGYFEGQIHISHSENEYVKINNGIFRENISIDCNTKINNGKFYSNYSANYSETEINDGIFYGVINNGSENIMNMNSGHVYSYIRNSGKLNINNAVINNSNGNGIENTGTLSIDKSTSIITPKGYALKNESAGTASLKECTLNSSGDYYGIHNAGKLILGENDEEISTQYPLIINGVYNVDGNFSFYDGKIIDTPGRIIRGCVNSIPDNCEVLISNEDSKQVAIVGVPTEPVAKIEDTTYVTLQSAVNAVPTNSEETTIEILKDIYLVEKVTIQENQNIILNIKQHIIKGFQKDYIFENNGILEINSNIQETIPEISFANKIDKANYYFVEQDGKLVSNNKQQSNTTANSYIPVDLRNLTGTFELVLNARVSSETALDFGYACITNNTTIPNYNGAGRFMFISGKTTDTDFITTLTGGQMYYLHIGFYKNASIDSYDDELIVNNISINPKGRILSYAKNDFIKNTNKFVLNGADLNLYATGPSNGALYVIDNTGNLEINGGSIDSNTYDYVSAIKNSETGLVTLNGGIIKNKRTSITNAATGLDNNIVINGGNFEADYIIDNNSASNIKIEGGSFRLVSSSGYVINCKQENSIITINNIYVLAYESIINMQAGKVILNNGTLIGDAGSVGRPTIELLNNAELEMNNGIIYGRYLAFKVNTSNGKAIINNGFINTNGQIENNGYLEINNGEIYSRNTNATTAAINNKATLIMNNGTIRAEGRGILNSGTLTIKKGNVYGNKEIGINNTGTLTLGEKDGFVNQENPYIYGKTYGISIGTSTVNYYDGKIEGATNQSISGNPTEIEEGYEIIKTNNAETLRETAILDIMPIAQIGETTYDSLQEAFNACEDGVETEITITRNASVIQTVESAIIDENKNIVLNLNGYEVSAGNTNTIINKGKLTIKDSSENGTGKLKNTVENLILLEENGELVINNGTFEQMSSKDLIINNGNGNITVLAGNLKTATGNIITNNAQGKVTLSGGTYTSLAKAIVMNKGNLQVEDGVKIAASTDSIYVTHSNCNVVINGGEFTQIYNNAEQLEGSTEPIIIINNATTGRIINNKSGNILINNVSIDISYNGIENISIGQIIINNATISSRGTGYDYLGKAIYNIGGGTIDIKDGTYYGVNSAVYNKNGNVNIEGGEFTGGYGVIENGYSSETVEATMNINGGTFIDDCIIIKNGTPYKNVTANLNINKAIIQNTKETAILNYGSLTLGENDGIINNDDIIVTGKKYTIDNYATFNYYDGKITGAINESIYRKINNIPENAEIVYTKGDVEIATLSNGNIAKIGETYYATLNEAIKACSTQANESTTITLLKDIGIGGTYYEIKEGQDIILDLNGYRINQYNRIVNKGIFEITDNSEAQTGTIDVSDRMINNYGNLKISGGYIYSYMYATRDANVDSLSLIYNYDNENAKVEFKDMRLYNRVGDDIYTYIVYNMSNNDIKIENSNIEVYGHYTVVGSDMYVIYNNASTKKINIELINSNIIDNNENRGRTYGIYNNKPANILVSSGTIQNIDYTIYNRDAQDVDLTITNGAKCSEIYMGNGNNLTIDDAILTNGVTSYCSNEVIFNSPDCTGSIHVNTAKSFIINGGKTNNCVHISDVTNAVINNGIIDSIYIKKSNVLMLGGEINNTDGYGVQINSGTFTIGVREYPVITTEPKITGSTYGVIREGGNFNFYDGIITGTENGAISGTVNDTPDVYSVVVSEDGKVAQLGIISTFEQVALMNSVYYNTLEAAITAAGTTTNTIQLAKNIVLVKELEIAEGQNITIDLAGYSIKFASAEIATLINNGTLTIIDSTASEGDLDVIGVVQNILGTAIENNGTLTLGIDDGEIITTAPYVKGNVYGVENNGTFNFFDGKVEGGEANVGGTVLTITVPD